jgi:hypothetical protein
LNFSSRKLLEHQPVGSLSLQDQVGFSGKINMHDYIVTVHRDNSSKSPDDKADSSLLRDSGLRQVKVLYNGFSVRK